MKKINKKILLAIVIFLGCIGFVYALFQNYTEIANKFVAATHEVKFEENFEPETWPNLTTKEVKLVNNSNAPVIVRISYNELWSKEDGDNLYTLSNKINGKDIVTKNWATDLDSDWTYIDGWYYYNHVLDKKSSIKILSSIELDNSIIENLSNKDDYKSFKYELSFNHETVQASKSAVKELWGKNIEIENNNINWD